MEKLILIDGNSLMNRAYYAMRPFTTKDGTPTNGVFGFVKLLLKIISDKQPQYVVVVFDVHAPTFRHKLYPEYKAGRRGMPEDLVVQFPILKELLQTMQIKVCELPGYEADDIIGTLSRKYNVHSYIYSGDRDAYQLVDDKTSVCFTRKGVSDILELSSENFQAEVGLKPSQIIDLKALMGDVSDNIPGVSGIGEKTARSLLEKYETTEGVYGHLSEISGALHAKLEQGRESAEFSKTLATIDVNAAIDFPLSECLLQIPFPSAVQEKLSELEFKSLLTQEIFTQEPSQNETVALAERNVREYYPETEADALAFLQSEPTSTIACYWSDLQFSFFVNGTECILPIKRGLCDVGFFEEQLRALLGTIFGGAYTIIAYNAKEIRHKLAFFNIAETASYEDVGILKCLSDGLSNADSLDFCLNYFHFDEKYKAYGIFKLWEHYLQNLNEAEKKLYYEVELPLIDVLFDMETTGVCIDTQSLKEFSVRYAKELTELADKIYELAGEKFNINSTQKLGVILFEKLKIGVGSKKSKNSKTYKMTAETLEKYKDEHEIVGYVLRYRKLQKLRSTYVDGFIPLIVNGRIHTTYNQTNTQTGRLSSVAPNLQNIPVRTQEGRELRKLFIAREGCLLIDADYSQIELRLLAHFSGCKELVSAYKNGKDIHAITASQVFNVPLSEVTAEQRREAKAVNFGIIYGISAYGLGNDLGIGTKQAQAYIEKYFSAYPEVKTYMDENVRIAKENKEITTLLGRRRVLNELRSPLYVVRSFGERAAMNMPMQGSSADIIKLAMIGVHKKLVECGYSARLVLQVHDELVIECPEAEVNAVSQILKNEMENAVSLSIPLTVELGVGKSWYETK